MILKYNEWVEQYQPIKNPFTEGGSYDNTAFETYGDELRYILNFKNKKQVWTLIEGDNEEFWIITGYNIVNRMGYFITSKEWENKDIEVNDNEMITILDAMKHCWEFAQSINIQLSMNDLSDFFTSNADKEIEISTGKAKYLAIEFIEEQLGEELNNEQNDQIHNYYSSL